MVNAVGSISCSICQEELAGQEMVNHGEEAHPAHAIHRDCLLSWRRSHPYKPLTCVFRCKKDPLYVDEPWDFGTALRAKQCAICLLNLTDANPQLGPILNHGGRQGNRHRVHRECVRKWYVTKRVLHCSQKCGYSFEVDAIFTPAEYDALLRRQKIIGLVVSVSLGAFVIVAGCFSVFASILTLFMTDRIFNRHLIPLAGSFGRAIEAKANLISLRLIPILPAAVLVGSGIGLLILVNKIGNCFDERNKIGDAVLNGSYMGAVLTTLVSGILSVKYEVMGLRVVVIASAVSGALSGLFYTGRITARRIY